MVDDHYIVLGLEGTANATEIKAAFRGLASKYHPDKTSDPESAEKMIRINAAYSALKNPVSRLEYDKVRLASVKKVKKKVASSFFQFEPRDVLNNYKASLPELESVRPCPRHFDAIFEGKKMFRWHYVFLKVVEELSKVDMPRILKEIERYIKKSISNAHMIFVIKDGSKRLPLVKTDVRVSVFDFRNGRMYEDVGKK